MAQKRVILYSQPSCPPCFAVKNFLKAREVAFEYKDVMADPQALRELMDHNSRSTPTIVVGEGAEAHVMIGFDPEELDRLLTDV